MPLPARTGRPRRFCRARCRQADYRARRLAGQLGLGAGQVVIRRADLDRLGDLLYALECALEDAAGDAREVGLDLAAGAAFAIDADAGGTAGADAAGAPAARTSSREIGRILGELYAGVAPLAGFALDAGP